MPDFATHFIFGDQVYHALPAAARSTLDPGLTAWRWGLQGPDPLFFHKLLGKSPLPGWGGVMHREKTAALFDAGLRYVYRHKGQPQYPLLRSYFLGFLCHYLLDRSVHPYVYWRESVLRTQLPPETWRVFHFQIETEMDNQLYPLYFDKHVLAFDPLVEYPVSAPSETAIGEFLAALLEEVYGLTTSPKEAAASLKDCRFCTHLLYDSSGWVVRYLTKAVDTLTGVPDLCCSHVKGHCSGADVLNLAGQPWYNARLPHILRHDNVLELMEHARDEAVELITAYLAMLETGELVAFPFDVCFVDGRLEKV